MKKYAIYTVCEISEDMDFGCEERPADVQRMAVVTLTDPKGASLQVKQPDDMLYEREIEVVTACILIWMANCKNSTL